MPAPSSADAAGGTHLIDQRLDTLERAVILPQNRPNSLERRTDGQHQHGAIREGRVNLKDSYGKVEGVAKGKKSCDKRETIKRRQIDRETRVMVKERSR